MQVNTIVVGVDGSDNAQRAIEAAVDSIAEGGTMPEPPRDRPTSIHFGRLRVWTSASTL